MNEPNVGHLFKAWSIKNNCSATYKCTEYKLYGYMMQNVNDPTDTTCVSERAIGRTYHKLTVPNTPC